MVAQPDQTMARAAADEVPLARDGQDRPVLGGRVDVIPQRRCLPHQVVVAATVVMVKMEIEEAVVEVG